MLPDEVIELIFSYLPLKDLYPLREISFANERYLHLMNIIIPKYRYTDYLLLTFPDTDFKFHHYDPYRKFKSEIDSRGMTIVAGIGLKVMLDTGIWYTLKRKDNILILHEEIPSPLKDTIIIEKTRYQLIDGVVWRGKKQIRNDVIIMDTDQRRLLTLDVNGILYYDNTKYQYLDNIVDFAGYYDSLVLLDEDYNLYYVNMKGSKRPRFIDSDIYKIILIGFSEVYVITADGYLREYIWENEDPGRIYIKIKKNIFDYNNNQWMI